MNAAGSGRDAIDARHLQKTFGNQYRDFFKDCDIVVSAPGTVFLTGEKVIVEDKATATCFRVPRRVHVGLRRLNDTAAPRFRIVKSLLLHESPKGPVGPFRNDGNIESLVIALRCLETGYRVQYEKPLSCYEVFIWSDWKGETGLGWSGAFAAALACALLLTEEQIKAKPEEWPTEDPAKLRKHSDFQAVVKLAWIVESVIHNGRASGSAVCGSMLSTGVPYTYSAPEVPRLWKLDVREEDEESRSWFLKNQPRDIYKALLTYDDWKFDYSGFQRGVKGSLAERYVAGQLFSGRQLLVIHTNVPKSTGTAASQEWQQGGQQRAETKLVRDALVDVCNKMAKAIDDCVVAAGGVGDLTLRLNESWDKVIDLLTRARGLLMALGFSFPVGDEILGTLRSEYARTSPGRQLGGKSSGAGNGGNLVVAARGFPERHFEIHRIIDSLRKRHTARFPELGPSQMTVMYDAWWDGLEPSGLRMIKLENEWSL